jgi:hypothetical protein
LLQRTRNVWRRLSRRSDTFCFNEDSGIQLAPHGSIPRSGNAHSTGLILQKHHRRRLPYERDDPAKPNRQVLFRLIGCERADLRRGCQRCFVLRFDRVRAYNDTYRQQKRGKWKYVGGHRCANARS